MALTNTEYGKAYEYACLLSLKRDLAEKGVEAVTIVESDALTLQDLLLKKQQAKVYLPNLLLRLMLHPESFGN